LLQRGEYFERVTIRGYRHAEVVKSRRPVPGSAPSDLQIGGEFEDSFYSLVHNRVSLHHGPGPPGTKAYRLSQILQSGEPSFCAQDFPRCNFRARESFSLRQFLFFDKRFTGYRASPRRTNFARSSLEDL
jgi:hypothetical protein